MRKTAKTDSATDFSPEYSIRASKKARRIILKIHPSRGLEVVLPQGASPDCVPEVINRHKAWIQKHLARHQKVRDADGSGPSDNLSEALPSVPPRFFYIKGGTECVRIIAADPTQVFGSREESSPGRTVPGELDPAAPAEVFLPRRCRGDAVFSRLREWVRKEARAYLGGVLERSALQYGLAYEGVSVRFQRTRWGSCSAKGHINLNGCLLFLPEKLSRYVVLHELCHLRHMDHSDRFWRMLFTMEPEALAMDKALRSGWRHVPDWFFNYSS